MACLCGDYCCPSCGPAQGNWRCPICHEWASEGCEHVNVPEDGPATIKPEYAAEVERLAALEAAAEAAIPADIPDWWDLPEAQQQAAFAKHQAEDPHCTCNDCIEDFARRSEA